MSICSTFFSYKPYEIFNYKFPGFSILKLYFVNP